MKNKKKILPLLVVIFILSFFILPSSLLVAATPGCCIVHNECEDMEKTWYAPDESKCASKGGKFEEKACSEIALCKTTGSEEETASLDAPVLQSSLPGLTLTSNVPIVEKNGAKYYNIPWIAEYVSALYKFGVGAISILAVIMIMVGGFIWLSAGGNQERVTTAKGYINGAVIGLVIAMGSYTVLKVVNPALVNLKPLKIMFVPYEELISISQAYMALEGGAVSGNIGDCKNLEAIYKQAAQATNVPWEVLAAVHFRENNCNPNPPPWAPKGGPFQFDPPQAGCDQPFLQAAICSGKWLQMKVNNKLTQETTDINLIKTAIGKYNGSGSNGFYVMNQFDSAHQGMRIKGTIEKGPKGCPKGSVDTGSKCRVDTIDKRPGALKVYCEISQKCN